MWIDRGDRSETDLVPPALFDENQLTAVWANTPVDQVQLERLSRENKEVTTLYNMGIAVAANLSLKQVLWTLYKESSRLIDTSNFALGLYDASTHSLDFALIFAQAQRAEPFTLSLTQNAGLAAQVVTRQTHLLIDNLTQTDHTDILSQMIPQQTIRSWLGVPILNPLMTEAQTSGVIVTWSERPHAFGDHELWLLSMIGTQAAIAIRNARLFEQSQRRALELAVINDVARTFAETYEFKQMLNRLLEQIQSLLQVEWSCLHFNDPATGEVVFQSALESDENKVKALLPLLAQTLAEQLTVRGRPLVKTSGNSEIRNILAVPMLLHDQVVGVLAVGNKTEGIFTQTDRELLSSLAAYASIALENSRLYERVLAERERVVEAESQARKALAHSLHDGPTQLISAISMHLELVLMLAGQDHAQLSQEITATKDLAEQAAHQIRTLLFELRPLALETQGLSEAIRLFLERRRIDLLGDARLTVKIDSSNPEGTISRQEPKVEAALFAIVQEAVNNALKYARADQISVQLKETTSAIYMHILDDGQGFDVAQTMERYEWRGSLGMVSIRERAELIGGELTMTSVPGQGTQITVYVPKAKEKRMQKRAATGWLSR